VKKLLAVLAPLALVISCGSPSTVTTASTSATPPSGSPAYVSPPGGVATPASPSAPRSPAPSGRSYGVLVDLVSPTVYYTVSVVGVDGLPWAQLRYARRAPITTASGHAVQLPLVSASLTALYMLDGDSMVEEVYLADGHQSTAARLPVSTGEEVAFAVSPDDSQMAYSVLDFNRTPVHVTLYVQTFNGDSPAHKIFESDTDYVWPVAWHHGLLVLAHAYGPYEESIAKAAPARGNPYSAISYHVVDPSNAGRKVLMGSCTVSGLLSPAGSGCIQGGAIDWQGNTAPWSTTDWGTRSSAASLSPDGRWVAATSPNDPSKMAIWAPNGNVYTYIDGPGLHDWAGWIDDDTIITGSDGSTWQPQVANVIRGGVVHDVTAFGFVAAILPTNIV
jgi:hypothetical protein